MIPAPPPGSARRAARSIPARGGILFKRAARVLKSSSFRLAVLYVLMLSGSATVLLGFIYWSTAGFMDRQTDATIGAEIQGLAEQYRQGGLAGLSAVIGARVARDPTGAGVYLLADQNLTPLIGNLDRWPTGLPDPEGWMQFRLLERGPDRTEEHAARGQVFRLEGGLMLLVGRDIRDHERSRKLILDALIWGLAISAALALLGGWVLSHRVLRRLEAINQTSRRIMDGDLSRRIPVGRRGDDFDQLASGLNHMLERIESLMAGVRQVSDNIAHDLRTPLTRLRSKLEVLHAELGADHPAAATAEETIADAEEILATFNALLRIARIEAGGQRAAFAPVDLAPLVIDLADLYEPVAAERDQQFVLHTPGPAWVIGDRDLLFQALSNLVDNAIKYTPQGGAIELRLQAGDGHVTIEVADNGPGIPRSLHGEVFRRFYRVDDSRSTPGSGLGLSLVQAVVQLHGATIELLDNHPGLRARLRLERVPAPPPGPNPQPGPV